MLTDKNKERLGKLWCEYIAGSKELNYITIGSSIEKFYNYILRENERDERDMANGKGQS